MTAESVQEDFDAWWEYEPPAPQPEDADAEVYTSLAGAIREGVNGL